MFVPDNDVAHNLWYWRDLDGMVASMLGSDKARVAPLVAHFSEAGKLSKKDLAELRRLIEELDNDA